MPLDIIYEDSDLIVINKAAGMVVHGLGHGSGTLSMHCWRTAAIWRALEAICGRASCIASTGYID